MRVFPLTWLLLIGCGDPTAVTAQFVIPFETPLVCAAPTELATMSASMFISGHGDCLLEVQEDLSASGSCVDIAGGALRFLAVEYLIADNNNVQFAALEYLITSVDLRAGVQADSDVELNFTGPGTFVITDEAQLDALPDDPAQLDDPEDALGLAQVWAKEAIRARGRSLDNDGDGESNIDAACRGGLF